LTQEKREPGLTVVEAPRPDDRAHAVPGEEITLASLWRTTRRGLWTIVLIVLVVLGATVAWLNVRTPVFEASATVAPAARDLAAAGRLVAELEQFAGLATFAQVPERIDQVSTLERFFELLGSVRLAERLEEEHRLLREVFPDQWDAASESWHPPEGLIARLRLALGGLVGAPEWSPPTPVHLARYLEGEIAIRRSSGGLFQLRLEHRDADLAQRVLTVVIATADDLLRQETLDRVDAQVAHLEDAVERDLPPARHDAIEDLLKEHYQTQALLEVDQPFAVETVSPSVIDPMPVGLDPVLFVILAAVVGTILGLFVVFLRDALRRNLG
jgi:hypothetical protein